MERQVALQHHGAATVQAGVHEGEVSPFRTCLRLTSIDPDELNSILLTYWPI